MNIEQDRKKEIEIATKILQIVKDDYQSFRQKPASVLAEEIKRLIDKEVHKYDN